jgi:hypothetical protein
MPEAADLSYERLASTRTAACQLTDSGVLFIHERTHLTEIIARIDAGVHLKRERDRAKTKRSGTRPPRGGQRRATPEGNRDPS